MKLERWTRFSWELNGFTPVYSEIDTRYSIRTATVEDERAVRAAVLSTFTLDSHWNYLLRHLSDQFESSLDLVFESGDRRHSDDLPCLVITHGARIIGASALNTWPEAENHLLTGPCVSMEYRNRGLGTALLAQSLLFLKATGVKIATGLTRQNTPTEKFLYAKFGSIATPYNYAPASVA